MTRKIPPKSRAMPNALRNEIFSLRTSIPTDAKLKMEIATNTGYAFETSSSFKAYAKSKTLSM